MKSIRLENLRSLSDTGYIKTEGLTVIVGENSIGKSTIVRSLPLLKQSIETKTTTPFLWFGEYTDFGSFQDSLNKENKDGRIVFHFRFTIPSISAINMRYRHTYLGAYEEREYEEVELGLYVKGDGKKDFIDEINISIIDNKIKIIISKNGKVTNAYINNENVTDLMKDCTFFNPIMGIVPELYIANGRSYYSRIESNFYKKLIELLKKTVRKNTKRDRIEQIINSFQITKKDKFREKLLETNIGLSSWDEFIRDNKNNEYIDKIRNVYIGYLLPCILDSISEYLRDFSENIYYIAPLRANAKRYYRNQNLAVDSVDFQGMNLPMVLANLSNKDKNDFSKWVNEKFGFGVCIKMGDGHISLNIKRGNELDNMVDCGFGYSQILPIITQLWLMINNRRVRGFRFSNYDNCMTLIIEQPELHLHPKMQGKLIDAFAQCVRSSKGKINIIIETHSETVVNRIGDLISEGMLPKEKTNLYVLSRKYENVIVEEGKYDNEGILENWPIDFFNVEDINNVD